MLFRKLFLIGIIVIPLISCDDPDSNFETNANLLVDITLKTTPLNNDAKSNLQESYFMEGFSVFCIANKDKLSNCPGNILGVFPGGGATLKLSGLNPQNEIHSLKLLWGYAPFNSIAYNMHNATPIIQNTIQTENGHISISIDELLQPVIGKMNENPRAFIFIMLTGKSNIEQSIQAQLKIPVIVKSEIVSPHFTL